jgi:hypothetical protein
MWARKDSRVKEGFWVLLVLSVAEFPGSVNREGRKRAKDLTPRPPEREWGERKDLAIIFAL